MQQTIEEISAVVPLTIEEISVVVPLTIEAVFEINRHEDEAEMFSQLQYKLRTFFFDESITDALTMNTLSIGAEQTLRIMITTNVLFGDNTIKMSVNPILKYWMRIQIDMQS
jgi:hypothetical protein